MKTILHSNKKLMVYSILAVCFFFSHANAATIQITVSNNSFSPNNITCMVGDVIEWVWLSGSHTTTSATIPSGAAAWNSNMNSTSTSSTYTVTTAGMYDYVCNFHPGMAGSFTASLPTGIADFSSSNYFMNIFPNPASGKFRITLNQNIAENISIDISDITGKKVLSLADNKSMSGIFTDEFDIAGKLEKGIYFISVREGEKNHMQIIIVN